MNYKEIMNKLMPLMQEVGIYQVEKFNSREFDYETKSTEIDIVTEVDKHSEKMLIDALTNLYPDFGFLAEESGETAIESEYIWVIDPLDGTTNFSTGIPVFAISVALQKNNHSLLGAVYMPLTQTMYTAIRGQGAYKNNQVIKVNDVTTLQNAVLATGFPYDRATTEFNNIKEFTRIVTKVKGIRRLGAAAYDFCLLAEGVYTGYWEYRLKPWDYAAGLLIACEAGAVFEKFNNKDHSFITSNKHIFDELKETLDND